MCQDIPSSVMQRSTNQILTAIVHGMRNEEASVHVRLAATNALLNSLELARANFENEVYICISECRTTILFVYFLVGTKRDNDSNLQRYTIA